MPTKADRRAMGQVLEEIRCQRHWLAESRRLLNQNPCPPDQRMQGYFLEVKTAWHRGQILRIVPFIEAGGGVNQHGPSLGPIMDVKDHCWVATTLAKLADYVLSWYGMFWVVEESRGPAIVHVVGEESIRVTYLRPQKRPSLYQSEWIGISTRLADSDKTKRELVRWSTPEQRARVTKS